MSEDLNFDPNEDEEDYNPENFRAVVERMFENMHGVARIERSGVVLGNRARLSEFRQRTSSGTQQRPRRQRVRRARHNTEPTSRNSDDSDNETNNFDWAIAAKHKYLSVSEDVFARKTLFPANEIITLPVMTYGPQDLVLFPGQDVPINAVYPSTKALLSAVLKSDSKLMGYFIDISEIDSKDIPVYEPNQTTGKICIGCSMRVRHKTEESPDDRQNFHVSVVAECLQRFVVQKTWSSVRHGESYDADEVGYTMAQVRILPEVNSSAPFGSVQNKHKARLTLGNHTKPYLQNLLYPISRLPRHLIDKMDPFQRQQRIVKWLQDWCKLPNDSENNKQLIPTNPRELSYWAAQQVPANREFKITYLAQHSPQARLELLEQHLNNFSVFLGCQRCQNRLSSKKYVFVMSSSGVSGNYVNPHGYAHHMMTLRECYQSNIQYQGPPSEEYSWFPGYSWQVIVCSTCYNHIGWEFVAVDNDLRPRRFFGLSLKSITTHFVGDSRHIEYSGDSDEDNWSDYDDSYGEGDVWSDRPDQVDIFAHLRT